MLNLHLLECTLKGYDHISDLLLAKYWVTIGCKYEGCKALQSIDIPNSVTTIENDAFESCSALQSIEIPNSVTTIESFAFRDCSALKSIHLHWTQLDNIKIDNYALGKDESVNFEECTLYVPPGTRWEYRHHPVFGKFKNIEIEKQE